MHLFKNDSEASVALKNGDMSGLEYFYNNYHRALQQFLKSYCRDEALVEEMTQDAFLQLWDKKQKINPGLSVKNLLFTIAKNKVIDQVRKSRNHARIIQLQQTESSGNFTLDQVILADYNRLLSGALLQLPSRSREVFALSRTTHLSNVEISRQLNISVKTVEKNITKTLRFLRAFLEKQHILLLLLFLRQYFL